MFRPNYLLVSSSCWRRNMQWIKVNFPKTYKTSKEQSKFPVKKMTEDNVSSTNKMVKLAKVGFPGLVVISEFAVKTYGIIEPVYLKAGDTWISHSDDTDAIEHFYVHISGKTYWTLGTSEATHAFIKKLHLEGA